MAKRVTALKCPQCGSVKKQSIKEDHYICNHCDTEYFLDNDDININVNHNHRNTENVGNKELNKKNIAIGIIAAVLAFFLLFSQFLFSPSSGPTVNDENKYSDRPWDQMVYTGSDGKPKILFSVERTFGVYDDKKTEVMFLFYDPIDDRMVNEQKPATNWNEYPTFDFRQFGDSSIYFIADKINRLYLLDRKNNQLLDVTEKMLLSKPELASGLATIKFLGDLYGDGFQIMANDGKEYDYFPIANRLYADRDQRYADAEELSRLPNDAKEKNYYMFSEESSAYPKEPIQLIKYAYKEKTGHPIRLPYRAVWNDLTDHDRDKFSTYKSLFSYHDKRVSSYKDLTPGRTYFKPHIMYQEENRLYIKVLPNANPENVPLLQKIDTETGEIRWTYKPEAVKAAFDDISLYKDGIGLYVYNFGSPRIRKFILLNDKDGKPVKEIELDNFKLK